MIRRPPRYTRNRSSAASDVYKRQLSIFPLVFFYLKYSYNTALFLILFKLIIDAIILFVASIKFKDYSMLKFTFPMFLIYPFILVLIILLRIFNYDQKWKGRKVISS